MIRLKKTFYLNNLSMKNILITGSGGQLGLEFKAISAKYPNINFLFTTREVIDITNTSSVEKFFNENKIDFCVNCAAYTAVDKAEEDKENCFLVNATAIDNLGKICSQFNTTLIHISTDFVFDGTKSSPYIETDPINPINYYGGTKAIGEELALQSNPTTIIIRTSWLHSSFGKNFVSTIERLAGERDSLGIVFNQVGTPTYAGDLAEVVMTIIQSDSLQDKYGIYHFSNEGVASWYDFAQAVVGTKGLKCKILPIESKDYPTPAKRPSFSVLNKGKIKETFGLEIPYWRDSLKCYADK